MRAGGAAAAAVALVACGLLMLSTTQPWASTVTELAPGTPRWREGVTGSALVPWLAPVAAVGALTLVAGLARFAWGRWAALLALAATVAGSALGLVRAGETAATTVSSRPTAWPWIALGAAVVALLATALWRPSRARRGGGDGRRAAPARAAWEEERRQAAQDWRAVSEGEEPGAADGWHNEG